MEKKFTPGPWKWKQDSTLTGFYIETVDRSHNNTFIAEVGGGLQSMFEVGSNAHLIAAAPELLDALMDLLQERLSDWDPESGEQLTKAEQRAQDAIAKALN